ncbi:SURF1 family protein [Roseixanthobacter pseudopolyaromaticivorans]|uniref:SURF1 family protein n=1 Tax=Xanthobacteraceae TaxID=335928 RepID=UPI00372C0B6C
MSGAARRGLLLPTLATFAALAVLIGLGTWQLERLSWKNELVAQVQERATQHPHPVLPVSQWPSVTREVDEYQPVRATGIFDHGKETLVYTVLSDPKGPFKGPGFLVLTPLMLADGSAILVNRGFVPEDRRAPERRREGQIEGTVTITGLLRMPEEASWFVPANDPAHNAWFRRDPAEIGAARGLAKVAPFIIDADATANPGGLPQGGETRLSFSNRHLEYALTWYGLAVTLAGVYVAFVISRRRGTL